MNPVDLTLLRWVTAYANVWPSFDGLLAFLVQWEVGEGWRSGCAVLVRVVSPQQSAAATTGGNFGGALCCTRRFGDGQWRRIGSAIAASPANLGRDGSYPVARVGRMECIPERPCHAVFRLGHGFVARCSEARRLRVCARPARCLVSQSVLGVALPNGYRWWRVAWGHCRPGRAARRLGAHWRGSTAEFRCATPRRVLRARVRGHVLGGHVVR